MPDCYLVGSYLTDTVKISFSIVNKVLFEFRPHLKIRVHKIILAPLCQHSTHKKGFESFASRFVVRLLHATSVPNRAKTLFQKLQAKRALQKPYSRTEMIERKI